LIVCPLLSPPASRTGQIKGRLCHTHPLRISSQLTEILIFIYRMVFIKFALNFPDFRYIFVKVLRFFTFFITNGKMN
jgi:hypothetical protein